MHRFTRTYENLLLNFASDMVLSFQPCVDPSTSQDLSAQIKPKNLQGNYVNIYHIGWHDMFKGRTMTLCDFQNYSNGLGNESPSPFYKRYIVKPAY